VVCLDVVSLFCGEMGNHQSHTSEAVLCASDKRSLRDSDEASDAAVISSQSHAALLESPVIRQLILHCNEKLDEVIFVVKKGWILRFILGPSLYNLNVRIFINCQSTGSDEEQCQFELVWHKQHFYEIGSFAENIQIFADVQATVIGSFHYFFTIDGSSQQESASGNGYFIVQPELKVRRLKTIVPVHGIVCQTLLSKNLGRFSGWLQCLIVAKKTGYNAIHFTPLQVSDYYPHESQGICFHQRWLVCVCVYLLPQ